MGSQHRDSYDFAGDYNLNGIILQAHDGTGGRFGEGGVDIMPTARKYSFYPTAFITLFYGRKY